MAAWRRRALELFPQLGNELPRREFTIYMLYFDLLPMVRSAHDVNNEEELRRIYGFAEWCMRQKAENLWNSAAVCFYEHLFDIPEYRTKVVSWLSPFVIEQCWGLWERRLTEAEIEEVKRLVEKRSAYLYRNL
jgi:hypothetical protein